MRTRSSLIGILFLCAAFPAAAQDAAAPERRFGQADAPPAASAADSSATPSSERRFGQSAPAPEATAPADRRAGRAAAQSTAAQKKETASASARGATRPAAAKSATAGKDVPQKTSFVMPSRDLNGQVYVYLGAPHAPFHVAPYHWADGQTYHRYDSGAVLPHNFWLARYFISNPQAFGLAVPAQGHQWLRYGPDLVLIDLRSGSVADCVAGAFEEGSDASDDPLNGDDQ